MVIQWQSSITILSTLEFKIDEIKIYQNQSLKPRELNT